MDGLPESTTYTQLKRAFNMVGNLAGVYVQRSKRRERRTKFGFVRLIDSKKNRNG